MCSVHSILGGILIEVFWLRGVFWYVSSGLEGVLCTVNSVGRGGIEALAEFCICIFSVHCSVRRGWY